MPRKTEPVQQPSQPPKVASMRPRPDAAENSRSIGGIATTTCRFNEAAARCRGKPAVVARDDLTKLLLQ